MGRGAARRGKGRGPAGRSFRAPLPSGFDARIIAAMSDRTVVSRFAPSPTGYLHVGGARTALFSWLLARRHRGRFLLRIEDTDLARSTERACVQLLEDLRWLGLHWDNDPVVRQSARLEVYDHLIDDLKSRGLAYDAYETAGELDALRKVAEREKRAFIYRRREPGEEEKRRFAVENRPAVVRLAMPVREFRFHDAVLDKDIVMPAEEAQDFVIRKTDGMPTYHFAVVVDDHAMGISHVLRGQEHLKNTFYHLAIQEALGYAAPTYGHLPIILNIDGSKMGKRDRDKKIRVHAHGWMKNSKKTPEELAAAAGLPVERIGGWLKSETTQLDLAEQQSVMEAIGLRESDLPEILVHDFRKNGYLPEALLNFLALLGWNPGGDRERMSMDELVEAFDIGGIGKSNARFDRAKLLNFNTEAAASADPTRLVAVFREYLSVNPESPLNGADDAMLGKLLAMKKGFRTLREVDEPSRFLFLADAAIQYTPEAVEKVLKKQNGRAVLVDLNPILRDLPEWTAETIERAVEAYCQSKSLGLGKVAQPLRVAVSGSAVSPPIFQSLELLGRPATLARLERCLAETQASA